MEMKAKTPGQRAETETRASKASIFAAQRHSSAGCTYHGLRYEIHLHCVVDIAIRHKDLISLRNWDDVLTACWCHDILEDCPITYNDLVEEIGKNAAKIVYDVTDELGKNRRERAERTYPKIAANPLAVFVKLCDRIANVEYSIKEKSSMLEAYQKQWPSFRAVIGSEGNNYSDFQPLWKLLGSYLDHANTSNT